jgi:hypothetical protein
VESIAIAKEAKSNFLLLINYFEAYAILQDAVFSLSRPV